MVSDKNKIILGAAAAFLFYSLSKAKGGSAPGIMVNNIVDELEHHPTQTYNTRSLSQVNKIIVHHYAGSGTPQQIAHYHVSSSGNNWPGIGYHFTISKNGTISQTNYLDTVSYHVSGQNTSSIGVALEGNFQNENPTPQQIASLDLLIPYVRSKFSQSLQVYGHSDFNQGKPFDPNLNLQPYKIAGVYYQNEPGLYQCQDGTFTDLTGQGSCSNHGGIYDPLKDITEADLETYFYKDYNLALYLAAEKIDPESWRRYGDSQLSKEKFMWLKKGGAKLDDAADDLSSILNIPIEPQDFIDIIMISDNPYTYINDLKDEVNDIFKRQGIGNIYSLNSKNIYYKWAS